MLAWEGIGDADVPSAEKVAGIVDDVSTTLQQVGGAEEGDKTMLDALLPFSRALKDLISGGGSLSENWNKAATVAAGAAQQTADLSPKIGRARPLAEKSVGHADPGAVSLAYVLATIGDDL